MAYPYTSYQNPYQQGYYPYQQQPMMQQPMQQQPVQQPTQPMSYSPAPITSGILWVDGDMDASAFPLAPNTAIRLWHKTKPIVYFKQCDSAGKPSLKKYDLIEHVESDSDGVSDSEGKVIAYAKEEDLKTVVGAVKGLDGIIGAMKADIDALKADMYGVAGKRKATRKQTEVSEDDE